MPKYGSSPKKFESKLKLNKPIFIEGLPGIANVGKIAVDFMIDELKAKKLYSICRVRHDSGTVPS